VGVGIKVVWEWVQCAYLYDMSGSTLWKGAVWMSAATVADGFLMLAVAGIAALLGGAAVVVLGALVWQAVRKLMDDFNLRTFRAGPHLAPLARPINFSAPPLTGATASSIFNPG